MTAGAEGATAAARRPAESAPAAARWAAAWLFVLPMFTAGVAKDVAKAEVTGLALLAIVAIFHRHIDKKLIVRICGTAVTVTAILGGYLIFNPWPSSYGSVHSYDAQAVIFVASYAAVAVFALLLFDKHVFERVVWQAATGALWIAVAACVISRLGHRAVLVSPSHGALRLQGTLSEPSAWAPALTVVVLLALRRRSWHHVALAAVGLWLAASPTCILVLAVTVPAYYLLVGDARRRLLLSLGLAAGVPAVALFVQTASPAHYLAGHNTAEVVAGRLVSGIHNIESGGRQGANTRFASTTIVIGQLRANDWLYTGTGPAAENTYFPARFPADVPAPGPHALWVSTLFDFGVIGVAVMTALMLTAVWRMHHHPGMTAILLPFFAASLINSAEGSFEYSFVALGILLFALGWFRPACPVSDRQRRVLEARRGLVQAVPGGVPPR